MKNLIVAFLLCLVTFGLLAAATPNEDAVWKLENSYWKDVQTNDLETYRSLWHPNFVGWPSVSAAPVHKDHITDWIADNTSKGRHLDSYKLEEAASQATENVVVTHYWITIKWVDKAGAAEESTTRICHTWIKTSDGWQIIGGMSCPALDRKF
jgi:ketosteroid isomerase-like protein